MLRDMSALQIILAIAGIGLLIAWHELGHYTVARLLGMRVLKYSIGFGPKLWGFRKGDIDYQIAVLPLGGFVQIKGMSPLEDGAVGDPRSFCMRPRWARWLVLAAGPGFNYVMAAVLFFVYFAAWPSPVDTAAVEITAVNPAFTCRATEDCPDAWSCADSAHVCTQPGVVLDAQHVEDSLAAIRTPAAAAGLLPGDLITHVDGLPLAGLLEFKAELAAKHGAPVVLHVLRNGAYVDVPVAPVAQGSGFVIGIAPQVREAPESVLRTAWTAIHKCGTETERTLAAFGALFRREPGVDVGSPVMIVREMKDQIAHGARSFVLILAMLSVNLGLLNLLPVPSLDGIKMLFLTIEGAVRRDLHAGFQVWVNAIGLLAILGLMVVLMARDTLRLLG